MIFLLINLNYKIIISKILYIIITYCNNDVISPNYSCRHE